MKISLTRIQCTNEVSMDGHYLLLKKHSITAKQFFVLKEFSNSDINATELSKLMALSPITMHGHLAELRRKLKVNTNHGLIAKAHRLKIINLDEVQDND